MYTPPWPLRLLARLPFRGMAWISHVLSWLWWYVFPLRRRVACENLQRALPGVEPGPVLRRMMQELVLGYLEILRFDDLKVEITGTASMRGQPGILLGGHLGSWDVGVMACSDVVPMAVFFKKPNNRYVYAWLEAQRQRHQLSCLWDGSRLEDGLAELDAGKILLFVQDQRLNRGVELPFFGHPARTSMAFAAAIQRRPQYPVWAGVMWREAVGRHRVHFAPFPMPERSEDPAEDRRLITLAANQWYETQIRARPWSWLWLHRRWK
jgi:Kdo2-lipid IVA lauroyltransferase/acyltransferase